MWLLIRSYFGTKDLADNICRSINLYSSRIVLNIGRFKKWDQCAACGRPVPDRNTDLDMYTDTFCPDCVCPCMGYDVDDDLVDSLIGDGCRYCYGHVCENCGNCTCDCDDSRYYWSKKTSGLGDQSVKLYGSRVLERRKYFPRYSKR